jgi:hypothetical protein
MNIEANKKSYIIETIPNFYKVFGMQFTSNYLYITDIISLKIFERTTPNFDN